MLIDSHHHLWRYNPDEYGWIDETKAVLRQNFLISELRTLADEEAVDGFVTVQARQTLQETEDLLAMAAAEPLIRGVVGWVPLRDSRVESTLEALAQNDRLVGVRHVVQDEPDAILDDPDFNAGVALLEHFGVVYDLLIFGRQLPAAIQFVDRHPSVRVVLDHVAKPTITGDRFDATWASDLRDLARRDHVTCKFSGVTTEVRDDSWSIETIRPYWDVALEAFTPNRMMFGSDWPVCTLATDYRRWLTTVKRLAAPLSDHERAALFANNAISAYQLGE